MPARPGARDRARAWWRRLRSIVHSRATDRRTADELAFHLDMETEQNLRRGMGPAEARRAALIAFGGVDCVTEGVRDARNIPVLDDLLRDLRHGVRTLRRSPGFAVSAIAALSLGIGANSAVFSVVHAVVIADLPYAEPNRLVRLWESNPTQRIERGAVSPGTFNDLRQRSHTLDGMAVFTERAFLFQNGTDSWESRTAAVSPGVFDLLGVRPIAGRTFTPETLGTRWSGSYDELIISHALWQSRFGGDPGVVGRTIRLDYRWSYTVVGIMPPGFSFPPHTDAWTPLVYGPAVSAVERQLRYNDVIARLRPGAPLDQAAREASAIATQLQTEYPASNAGWTVNVAPLRRSILGNTRPTLLVVLGLAGCVLLIACGNVATLAVARATSRRHEIAVRMALGADRARLARQWVTEAMVLATLGAAGGIVVGYWSNRLLLAVAPRDIPRLDEVTFGGAVIVFVMLVAFAVALMVGSAPALRSRDATALDAMRSRTMSGARGGMGSREWLLGTQIALTFVLTVAGALLVRSFQQLQATDTGFRRHDILSVELRVPGGRFEVARPWYRRAAYYERMLANLGQVPGVVSVGGTTMVPLTGELGSGSMWRTDAPGAHGRKPPTSAADQWKAAVQLVTPRYFETLGIPIHRGRAFTADDRFTEEQLTNPEVPKPPGVVIINEAMARRFWPNGNPLGTNIFLFDDQTFAAYRTVVGVVANVRAEAVDSGAAPTVYLPYAQNSGRSLSLVVRSSVPTPRLVNVVTNRLREFDAQLAIASVRPLDDVFSSSLARPRFTTLLVGCFAALALVIAVVGVFGIVGFLVARRTQELGIRMALGARPSAVLSLVLRDGLRPVLLGIAVGAVLAAGVARAMRVLLYETAPLDAVSFAAAAALLVVASLIAAVVPARRATGVDPLRALRSD